MSSTTPAANPQPDAPESNAGDDFHLLWAARRSLRLLHPSDGLKALRVEGPSPKEASLIDPDGDRLLGIDLSEYFGGDSFESATSVVFSQLKYSTRQSTKQWTDTRLAVGKDGKAVRSIVNKLAVVYKAYLDHFGRDQILPKLRIRLVSNRPCSPELLNCFAEIQIVLNQNQSGIQYNKLRALVSEASKKQLETLKSACGQLKSSEFCDFLRVFDLSFCGQGSRLDHELALNRALGEMGFAETKRQYAELKQFIWRRMQPESRKSEVVTGVDIAPILGVPDLEELFPAKPIFDRPIGNVITRHQENEIAKTVLEAEGTPVCIHGGAGIGKTTFTQSLSTYLPAGSVVIIFDCYGGGSFLDRSAERHSHPRAVMQIANELATSTGESLLLTRAQGDADLLKSLLRRLSNAAKLLQAQNPLSLVVVAIDAADNSIAAAEVMGERAFVSDFVNEKIPDGVRFVVTSRTHRVDKLSLPVRTSLFEIMPFQLSESRCHLEQRFPNVSETDAQEFHRLSNGVPRVQAYAISDATSAEEVLDRLRPQGKSVENLFEARVIEASRRAGSATFDRQIFPTLLALPRPIPISIAAQVSQQQQGSIDDFCVDMFPAMRTDKGRVVFKDEDFENFLRSNYTPDQVTHRRVADVFEDHSTSDPYAAANLSDALLSAGDHKAVIDLVYREKQPAVITDPVERKEVFARRARNAVAAVVERGDRTELLRLLFVIAQAAKADHAVEALLLEHADLACRFGSAVTVQKLYLNRDNNRVSWYGPTHLICAANFSRSAETRDSAVSHLNQAEAWISWWSNRSDDDRESWRVEENDVACGAEAVLRLQGSKLAEAWLSRWRPEEFAVSSTRKLVGNLIAFDQSEFLNLLSIAKLRALAALIVIGESIEHGVMPPKDIVFRTARVWIRFAANGAICDSEFLHAGILLCEACFHYEFSESLLTRLLDYFRPFPHNRPYLERVDEQPNFDSFLRATALRANIEGKILKPEDVDLLPVRLRLEPKKKDDKEHKQWLEDCQRYVQIYKELLPVYSLYVSALQPNSTADLLAPLKTLSHSGSLAFSTERSSDHIQLQRRKGLTLINAAVFASKHFPEGFQIVCKAFEKAPRAILLTFAERGLTAPNLAADVLRVVESVRQWIEETAMPASDKTSLLVRCCRIAGAIDQESGRHFFEMAVNSAEELDSEAFQLLMLSARLAERASTDFPALNERLLAEQYAILIEECHWRFDGHDHFPWSATIRGLTKLHPMVAATAICRWNQRGIVGIGGLLTPLIQACQQQDSIDPYTVVSWIPLIDVTDDDARHVIETALTQIKGLNHPHKFDQALKVFVDFVERFAEVGSRPWLADRVFEFARKKSFEGHPILRYLRRLKNLIGRHHNQNRRIAHGTDIQSLPHSKSTEEPVPWDDIVGSTPIIAAPDIESAITRLEDYIQERDPRSFGRRRNTDLLAYLKSGVEPKDFRRQLDALIHVDQVKLNIFELKDALEDRIKSWGFASSVRDWLNEAPGLLVRSRFRSLFYDNKFSTYRIDQWVKELGFDRAKIIDEVIKELPKHLRELGAAAILGVGSEIISSLPENGALDVLKYSVPLSIDNVLPHKLVVGQIDFELLPANSRPDASLLWFIFGHADKRRRWEAIHSARNMAQLGDSRIIPELERWLDAGNKHPFAIPETPFYWLAARHSFFLLVDRLAEEFPESVLPLADRLIQEVTNPTQPHALIMRLAQRAALRLAKHSSTPFTSEQVHLLEAALSPRVEKEKEKRQSQKSVPIGARAGKKKRFDFDEMDTLRYWYERPAKMFGLSVTKFCRVAESWICDQWGYRGGVWASDPIRKWRNDRDWGLYSNGHGSQPTIEDLQTYLEFNAMFCAAGELSMKKPVIRRQWDWERDPWRDWLNHWDLDDPSVWAADRRGRTPLQTQFWIAPADEIWKSTPNEEAFDRAVGFTDSYREGFVIVDASVTSYYEKDSESVEISSALVSTQTASSLIYALHTSANPHDYRVPPEGDELEFDELIAGIPFQFQGWIKDINRDGTAADEHDPLRGDFHNSWSRPGREFLRWSGMRFTKSRKFGCRPTDPKRPLVLLERWNDLGRGDREYGLRTQGRRLWIRFTELISFLKQVDRSLLLKCEIDRHLEPFNRSSRARSYAYYTKLYIIHPCGTVESPGSSTFVGETD